MFTLVEKFPGIQYLELSHTDITDAALEPLGKGCADLKHIALDDTNITDVGVVHLASGCKKIAYIDIGATGVTEDSAALLFEACLDLLCFCPGALRQRVAGGLAQAIGSGPKIMLSMST